MILVASTLLRRAAGAFNPLERIGSFTALREGVPASGVLVRQWNKRGIFRCLFAADPWEVTTGGSGSSVSTCQSLPSDCETTIRVMFRGVLPLCCAYAHNLQSYSRSFGFLSWGWSSIPFDMFPSQFSNEAHPVRWNTIPTSRRADPAVSASHWNFEIPGCDLQQATHGCPGRQGPVGTPLRFFPDGG